MQYGNIDLSRILQLAEEQAVVGLVAAGLEHLVDYKPQKDEVLQVIGRSMQLERRNQAMNEFIARLFERLNEENVYSVLVKGQGIAQCYERPLWRTSGDIDLLLSKSNYEKAKQFLVPLAVNVENEYKSFMHLGMRMKGGHVVELHGTMHTRLSRRVDKGVDEVQRSVFHKGHVRSWICGKTQVFLPRADEDVIFVFTHILHHFFMEGIGLRQICDWCRLLWTYKDLLNHGLLESRIRKLGLMSEWQAFATFAVEYLGMPMEAMPMYSASKKWSMKAEGILSFVLASGNFGHNRQYKSSNNQAVSKVLSAWYKTGVFFRHFRLFPLDSVKFLCHFMGNGIGLVVDKI